LKFVIFDMDGVLVDIDSSWQLVHRAFSAVNEDNFRRYLHGEIDYKEFMRTDISLWGKVRVRQIEDILDKAPLMPTAQGVISESKKRGYKTAIISSGISILAERVKRTFNIDYSFANKLVVDNEGLLTGEGEEVVELSSKDQVLKRLADKEKMQIKQCVAIGDSKYDISLFRESGLSIAFNTKDETVKKAADLVIDGTDLGKILPWLTSENLIKANFSLKYRNTQDAKAIVDSISPDNTNLPFGLSLRVWHEGKTVNVKALCLKTTETMMSTLNDLFACMQVAERTIKATESI
jgi:phosphoserine phosphatase